MRFFFAPRFILPVPLALWFLDCVQATTESSAGYLHMDNVGLESNYAPVTDTAEQDMLDGFDIGASLPESFAAKQSATAELNHADADDHTYGKCAQLSMVHAAGLRLVHLWWAAPFFVLNAPSTLPIHLIHQRLSLRYSHAWNMWFVMAFLLCASATRPSPTRQKVARWTDSQAMRMKMGE